MATRASRGSCSATSHGSAGPNTGAGQDIVHVGRFRRFECQSPAARYLASREDLDAQIECSKSSAVSSLSSSGAASFIARHDLSPGDRMIGHIFRTSESNYISQSALYNFGEQVRTMESVH